jgi:hypothetical protein
MRGTTLPKPQELAADEKTPWSRCEAELYSKRQKVEHRRRVEYKRGDGQGRG